MVFMLILNCISIQLKSQSNKGFTDEEVRKIAYIIECKKFLEQDTISYKNQIASISKRYSLLELKYKSLDKSKTECDKYSDFLYQGSLSLIESTASLSKENKKLKFKLKLSQYSMPIYFGAGVLTTILILK